jgi:hypothetical protein
LKLIHLEVGGEPNPLAGSLTTEAQEADHRRHAGQLNWQHAQDYFPDCHPEHNTPKHRSGTLLQQYPKSYNINLFETGLTGEARVYYPQ